MKRVRCSEHETKLLLDRLIFRTRTPGYRAQLSSVVAGASSYELALPGAFKIESHGCLRCLGCILIESTTVSRHVRLSETEPVTVRFRKAHLLILG